MRCPKCYSKLLDIRQPTGLEPIMIFLTRARKFRCRQCESVFRAADRRRAPREISEAYNAARAAGALR
ncbi:MAG TPA: hypothetical protein VHY84_01620 [Bryobacteraceae bacterium]|jgi:hypothetical protein|nr:hypothetical protein [Bryobacteraceae bacterium]